MKCFSLFASRVVRVIWPVAPPSSGNLTTTPRWRAALSYVTGAHSMKVGYEGQFLSTGGGTYFPFPSLAYRFDNRVPNQFTMQVPRRRACPRRAMEQLGTIRIPALRSRSTSLGGTTASVY